MRLGIKYIFNLVGYAVIMSLLLLLISSIITHNIVLFYFLGICPFIASSKDIETSFGMGCAVTFVMVLTTAIVWPVNQWILAPWGLGYLQYVVFIMVIGVLVQVVEIVIDRFFPVLYLNLGVFLPLITVNCAILGVALFMNLRHYGYLESLVFSAGSGLGFMLAICVMAGIRSNLRFSEIPNPLAGIGITLIIAAIMAMGFTGFAGFLTR